MGGANTQSSTMLNVMTGTEEGARPAYFSRGDQAVTWAFHKQEMCDSLLLCANLGFLLPTPSLPPHLSGMFNFQPSSLLCSRT